MIVIPTKLSENKSKTSSQTFKSSFEEQTESLYFRRTPLTDSLESLQSGSDSFQETSHHSLELKQFQASTS